MQVSFLVLGAQHVHDFAVLWSACRALGLALGVAFEAVLVEGVAAQEMDGRQLQGAVAHVTLGLLEYLGTVWKYWSTRLFMTALEEETGETMVCIELKYPSSDPPRFELLDLRAEVSSFFTVLADFAFVVLDLLTLSLQLVDEVVLYDGESGRRVMCKSLHHYGKNHGCKLMVRDLITSNQHETKWPAAHRVTEASGCFGRCGAEPR